MRGFVINKILSIQYRLGKLIGKGKASHMCLLVERTFLSLFGREEYGDKGMKQRR
jgi:hypothetical protein